MIDWAHLPLWQVALFVFTATTLRYFILTGGYYLVVQVLFREKYSTRKIENTPLTFSEMRFEMLYGVLNNLNYAFWGAVVYRLWQLGYVPFYTQVEKYGWIYLFLSVFILLVGNDAHFYWAHRLIHWRPVAKYFSHYVHHKFVNHSCFAAFSVHPAEGFIEVLYRPLIALILPLHPYAILAFFVLSFSFNILGHSGFEFFPSGYSRHPFFKFFGSASHHHIHHINGRVNFGLYFTWWDRICGTEYSGYHEEFEKNARRPLTPRLRELKST